VCADWRAYRPVLCDRRAAVSHFSNCLLGGMLQPVLPLLPLLCLLPSCQRTQWRAQDQDASSIFTKSAIFIACCCVFRIFSRGQSPSPTVKTVATALSTCSELPHTFRVLLCRLALFLGRPNLVMVSRFRQRRLMWVAQEGAITSTRNRITLFAPFCCLLLLLLLPCRVSRTC
jgi:hypothetical protein